MTVVHVSHNTRTICVRSKMELESHLCFGLLLGSRSGGSRLGLDVGTTFLVVAVITVVTVAVLFLIRGVRRIRGIRVGGLGLAVYSSRLRGRLRSRFGGAVDLGRSLLGLLLGLRVRRVGVGAGIVRIRVGRRSVGFRLRLGLVRAVLGLGLRGVGLGLGFTLDLLRLLGSFLLLAISGGLQSDVLGNLFRLGLGRVGSFGDAGVLDGRKRLAGLRGLRFLDFAHYQR